MDVPQNTDGKEIFFHKKGKATPVRILDEKQIGSGMFGDTFEAQVLVGDKGRKFVIKKFKRRYNTTAAERAENAMKNYQAAKEAGLKVFTTYRLGEDGTSILMTNANSDDITCLSTLPNTVGDIKIKLTDESFESLTDGVFAEAKKAADANIDVYSDAYFLLVGKNSSKLDFVLGDLDNVTKEASKSPATLLSSNLINARLGLHDLFQKYAGNAALYWDRLYKKYGEATANSARNNKPSPLE